MNLNFDKVEKQVEFKCVPDTQFSSFSGGRPFLYGKNTTQNSHIEKIKYRGRPPA